MAALYDGDGNKLFTMDYTGDCDNLCGHEGCSMEECIFHSIFEEDFEIWIPDCGEEDYASDGGSTSGSESAGGSGTSGDVNGTTNIEDRSNAIDAMKELASLVSRRAHDDYTITQYVNNVNCENEQVLSERNLFGRTTKAYIYGNNRLAYDTGEDISYYLYDGLGSVSRIATEWGRIKETYDYDPYGNLTLGLPDSVNYYGYNGESQNLVTGLQYLRARYYQTENARFISEDSYLGTQSEPLTRNRYAYVSNNPLNFIDPSGHYGLLDLWNDAKDFASDAWNGAKELASDAWNGAKELASNAWNGITNFASDTWNGLTDYYDRVNAIQKQNDELEREIQQIQTDIVIDGTKKAADFAADTFTDVAQMNYTAQVQKQQAEEAQKQAFCDMLEEHETEVKVVVGTTVIAVAGTATVLTGGATSQQLLGSIIGGVAGSIIHYVFAEGDKAAAAADGYMWGTITGALSPTIGHLVGQLGKTFTALSTPAVAAAIEGLLETAMEEFAVLMQGGEVNFGMFITDWAFNSVTSGANPQMQKLQKWFEGILDKGKNLIKTLFGAGDGAISSSTGKEIVEDVVEGGSKTVDINNPVLDNIRTGSALKGDSLHAFNDIIDNYAGDATKFSLTGGDGVERTLYQLEGSLNGKQGIFEWIVDPDPTKGVTHRRFIEGVGITGKPNARP